MFLWPLLGFGMEKQGRALAVSMGANLWWDADSCPSGSSLCLWLILLWSSELNIKVGLFACPEHSKPNWEREIKTGWGSTAELDHHTPADTHRPAHGRRLAGDCFLGARGTLTDRKYGECNHVPAPSVVQSVDIRNICFVPRKVRWKTG